MPSHVFHAEAARWNGEWHWPVRIAIFDRNYTRAERLLEEFRKASHVKRNLAQVGLFGRDFDSADILIVTGDSDGTELAVLDGRVGAIFCNRLLKSAGLSPPDLASIAQRAGAGAAAQIRVGPKTAREWLNRLIEQLSHGHGLITALNLADRGATITALQPDFDTRANIRATIDHLSRRIDQAPEAGKIVVPVIAADTFGLQLNGPRLEDLAKHIAQHARQDAAHRARQDAAQRAREQSEERSAQSRRQLQESLRESALRMAKRSLPRWGRRSSIARPSAPEPVRPPPAPFSPNLQSAEPTFGHLLREKSADFGFLRETHEATGVAALQASVSDAETGACVREADVTLYAADGETRLSRIKRLVPGETYQLQFAFRANRSGIGFDQVIEPLPSHSKEAVTLNVALAIGEGCEGHIPDAITSIELPPEGDSDEAWFSFKPLRLDDGLFRLDIRVYYKLNLLEHIVVECNYATDPVQRVLQPQRFRRYEGDLEKAYAPARLSVDVGSAPEYRLTVASPTSDGLQLTAIPTIGGEGLRTAIAEVRELWLDVAFGPFAVGVRPSTNASAQEKMRALASKGRRLWSMLFDRGDVDGEAKQLGRALSTAGFSRDTIIQINVGDAARPFVFPWTLLYDREVAEADNVDPDGFWGMRFIIEQRPTSRARHASERRECSTVSASLFFDRRIRQSAGQASLAEDLVAAAETRLALRDIVESGEAFNAALKCKQDDLLYFFCHGMTGLNTGGLLETLRGYAKRQDPGSAASDKLQWVFANKALQGADTALQLTKAVIYLDDLWLQDVSLDREPIVVLNMCESAQLLPDLTDSFVQYFLTRKASAVIGTECVIPADFGAAFGCELLPRLMENATVGEALLDARRKMMTEFSNPLGLAYTLWGGASARLKPTALPTGAEQYCYREGSRYV